MSPLSGEIWEMITAIAKSEVSVSTTMGLSGLKCTRDGCLSKGHLKGLKCLGVVRAPGEWGVIAHEVNQGDDNVRESYNELAIEVGEPQECLDCFEVGWGWPDT